MTKKFLYSLFVLNLSLYFSLYGQDQIQRKKYADRIAKHEKKLEDQIKGLPSLTDCDEFEAHEVTEISGCVKNALNKLPEKKIDFIEKTMKLKTFDLIKSKEKKEVVGYLVTKLEEKLYEGQKKKERKDQKYISETDFFDIYQKQVSHGVMVEVGTFCRSNVKYDPAAGTVVFDSSSSTRQDNDELLKRDPEAAGRAYELCLANIHTFCKNNNNQACMLKERMASMKTALAKAANIQKGLMANRSRVGFGIGSTYAGALGDKERSNLGTITSDLSTGDVFKKQKKHKENMEEACKNAKSKECREFISRITEEDLDHIKKQETKKMAIKMAAMDKVSEEDLKKFAESYMDIKNKTEDEIKAQLASEFQKQKDAVIERIKEKLHEKIADVKNESELKSKEVTASGQQDAKDKSYHDGHENQMRDNIFYANMVNSYLTVKDGDKEGSNEALRKREFSNFNKYGDKSDKQYIKQYQAIEEKASQGSQGNKRDIASDDGRGRQIDSIFKAIGSGVIGEEPEEK